MVDWGSDENPEPDRAAVFDHCRKREPTAHGIQPVRHSCFTTHGGERVVVSLSDVVDSVARTTEATFDRIDRDAVTAALPGIAFAEMGAAVPPAVQAISGEVAHAASHAWRTRRWLVVGAGAILLFVIGYGVLRRRRGTGGGVDGLPEDRADIARRVAAQDRQGFEAPATTRGAEAHVRA